MIEPVGTAILLTGIGLTFGALWLRRAAQPTEWAKVPALILFALAALFLIFGERPVFWAVALIVAGAAILVYGLVRKPATPIAPALKAVKKEVEKKPVVKTTVKKATSSKKKSS